MSDRHRLLTRENVYLLFWATVLGLAVAGAFGAYRAVDRGADLGQSRVGPAENLQHAHPRASSRLSLTILRVIIWRFNGLR